MQVLESGNNEYELIVHQRSSDLAKLEDDVTFFEYVMYKISQQTKLNLSKLTIFVGSQHYETNEG